MFRLRRPPLTVLAYVTIVVTLVVTLLPSEEDPGGPAAALLLLALSLGLVLGSWVAWLLLIVLETGNFIAMVAKASSSWWWAVVLKAITVALLASGPTRRYVEPPKFFRGLRRV
jgi:hypothetical protein